MTESQEFDQVLFDRRGPGGRLGVITLNRPKQLNALTYAMIRAIARQLDQWRDDDTLEQIVLVGAGDRGLCAGGDIAEIRADIVEGDGDITADFLADEYRLDASTSDYPKPYIAIMDGLTFGGGVGLSGHSTRRIVTERSQISMPETAIGFTPDIGGTWLLSRMPGETGLHAALTGARLSAGDAIATGWADHFVPRDDLDALLTALEVEPADEAIARFAQEPPAAPILAERVWTDDAYSAPTASEIVARLDELGEAHPGAKDAAAKIRRASPTAVAATLELVRRNREASDLRDAIDLEYRVGMRLVFAHDFLEGVRALLVDKDKSPKWQPATLAEVDQERIRLLFARQDAFEIDWRQS